MKLSEAIKIFGDINNSDYSVEQKGYAIKSVCGMETHNSISKDKMLNVIRWLLNLMFLCDVQAEFTNADHIRSMSDEELSKLLFDLGYEAYQYALNPNLKPIADTQDGWLEWLKQPSIWRGIDE